MIVQFLPVHIEFHAVLKVCSFLLCLFVSPPQIHMQFQLEYAFTSKLVHFQIFRLLKEKEKKNTENCTHRTSPGLFHFFCCSFVWLFVSCFDLYLHLPFIYLDFVLKYFFFLFLLSLSLEIALEKEMLIFILSLIFASFFAFD